MTGLRARQKADRNRRLLETASRLFRDHGYGSVRIEDIAAAADVSVGTFYNYFGTKGDVLLAIVTMEVEEVLAQGDAVVRAPLTDIEAALTALIGGYYEHSLVYLTKEMWRTAMALSIDAPETPFSRRYTELDSFLRDQVCALMVRFHVKGLLGARCDARALGEIIFNNLNMMFVEFVRDEDMTVAELMQKIARHNAALAVLIRP